MRQVKVKRRADRYDTSRIDSGMTAIVVSLYMVHIDGVSDTWYLVQIT